MIARGDSDSERWAMVDGGWTGKLEEVQKLRRCSSLTWQADSEEEVEMSGCWRLRGSCATHDSELRSGSGNVLMHLPS